jgi:hypothetical protein
MSDVASVWLMLFALVQQGVLVAQDAILGHVLEALGKNRDALGSGQG